MLVATRTLLSVATVLTSFTRPALTQINHLNLPLQQAFDMSTVTSGAAQPFLDALAERRSRYGITDEVVIPDSRVVEIVQHAVKHAPSAFNGQTTRVVVLFNEQSDKVWDITSDILRSTLPADRYEATAEKLKLFKAGHGTILFYDDTSIIRQQQENFKSYEAHFPKWAAQTSGMVQLAVWTAIEKEGYGATLQHYNPLINDKLQAEFDVPADWELAAQMPFGKPTFAPKEKEFKPIEERVKVFGAK